MRQLLLYNSIKILLIEFPFLLLNSNNIYFIDAMCEKKKKEQTFQDLCAEEYTYFF